MERQGLQIRGAWVTASDWRELRHFGLALCLVIPLAIAWATLIRWAIVKLSDRWFR